MKRQYELAVILKVDIKSTDSDKEVARLKKLITDNKVEVVSEITVGKKDFAYPIKKLTTGYYHRFFLEADSADITGLKTKLRMDEQLLRYLLFVVEKGSHKDKK